MTEIASSSMPEDLIPRDPARDEFVAKKLPGVSEDEDLVRKSFYANYLLLMIGCVGAIDAHKLDDLPDEEWSLY